MHSPRRLPRTSLSLAVAPLVALAAGSASALAEPAPAAESALPAAPPVCESGWVARVHEQARPSVVRITSAGGLGAGFVFHSPRHIATAFHVVSTARDLRIAFADESTRGARVVAADAGHDLAILETEGDDAPGAAPIAAAARSPAIGTPVMAIGHPLGTSVHRRGQLEGMLHWTATSGVVGAATGERVQTDAAVNGGNSGGPLLGCDGRLVGVVSSKLLDAEGLSFAIAAGRLVELERRIGAQPSFAGAWSFPDPVIAFALDHQARETLAGFAAGMGATRADRWMLRGTLSALLGIAGPPAPPLGSRRRQRSTLELSGGYRLLLTSQPFPMHLVPTVGAAAVIDETRTTTVDLQLADAACAAAGCPVRATEVPTKSTDVRVRPVLGLELSLAGAAVGYAFQPDLDGAGASHRFVAGLVW